MTVLMRARNSGDTSWITWSANAPDYEGIHAPEPILLNSAILEIIFGAAASKVDNDSTVQGTYVSDALDYLSENGGGGGITGPEVTTYNAIVRWDGTDGYFVKNSVGILNEIGGLSLGTDGYIEIGSSVSSVGDVRLDLGGYITGIVNGGVEIYGADGDNGGAINLLGGQSNAEDIAAPAITIQAGDGIGNVVLGTPKGGNVEISAGDSTHSMGGGVTIFGGTSANSTPFFDPYYGGTIRIVAGATTIGHGGDVFIEGGLTQDITETAGIVSITGGITFLVGGLAGSVSIAGGSSTNGTGGTAGVSGGNGAIGGAANIFSGTSTNDNGANINIWAGDSFGNGYNGGNVDIQSGTSYIEGNGGSITIQAKEGKGTGDGGDVIIQSGAAVDTGAHGDIEIRAYQGALTVWGHGGTNIFSQDENSGYINIESEHASVTVNNRSVNVSFGEVTLYGQSVFYDGYFAILDEREIRWYGGDSHYSGFKASAAGTTQIWTLPEEDGPDGYVLTTDGSGNLSWSEGNGGVSRFSDINFLSGTVQSDPAEAWVSVGYYSIDPNEISDATRLELEAFILTSNSSNAALLRLYNVTSDKQIGETIESTSETIERVRQAIVFPDIVGTTADTYRIEYSNSTAGDTVTIGGAKIRLRTDIFPLAFGSLPEIWPGAVGVVFPVTVGADIPWAVSGPSGESIATGTGTGSSQNATVSVPLLKSEATAIILSAGGTITDSAGDPMGGPYLAREVQRFEYTNIAAGVHTETITITNEPNRRMFVVFHFSATYTSTVVSSVTVDGAATTFVSEDDYKSLESPYYSYYVFEILDTNLPVTEGDYTLSFTTATGSFSTMTVKIIEFCDMAQTALVNLVENEGNSSAPSGTTTTAADDALAISFVFSTALPESLTNGYVVDNNDGVGGGYDVGIGVRRVSSPGATAMTWTLEASTYWGSLVFNLAGA
jgi:hypothetical protein